MNRFPIEAVRLLFPSLKCDPKFVFFDNAAGAQIPKVAFDAVNSHLLERNVQRGGRYPKSQEVDAVISRARENVGLFLNARDPSEIAFGMNATSFIRIVSLAVGQDLEPRDEIIVTDMDHAANVSTWLALDREGAKFRCWHMREDGNLHAEDLRPLLSSRTRLVACPVTSNALGSIVDVAAAAKLVHEAGAEIFLDCVHYAPHAPIDVQAFDCDYLTCSGYKIFAPHMGFLWGRREALVRLRTFHEEFIANEPPHKIEAGTFLYENVAGMNAVTSYLADLGKSVAGDGAAYSRRALLVGAMEAIRTYEESLTLELLRMLDDCGAVVYGIQDKAQVRHRVPTILFNLRNVSPALVSEKLAVAGIGVRDGHMYSPRLMTRLGLSTHAGAVRVALVHYNTLDEIHDFGSVLREIARNE